MPIGTGKVGLFGGVSIAIEAGSETFNAPGTFTVPADLKIVSLSGNGSAGNPGNAGSDGGDGIGGSGGSAPVMPTFLVPNAANPYGPSNAAPRYKGIPPGGQPKKLGAQGGVGGSTSPFIPFQNPPGGPGNPGNPGGATSALGYCWTGGTAGNGGTGGTDGSVGIPGTNGILLRTGCTVPIRPTNGPLNIFSYNGGSGGAGLYSGGNAGGAALCAQSATRESPCQTIWFQNASGLGGHGGGGAGISGAGGCAPNPTNPAGVTYLSFQAPAGGNWCNSPNINNPLGGNCGGGIAGRGAQTGEPSMPGGNCQFFAAENGLVNPSFVRAGGGGGGGGASAYIVHPGPGNFFQSLAEGATGGGGGGSGSAGNSGSGAGNPGNSGLPATFNCIPVTAGCYPIQVGTSGQVTISWNAQ